MDAINQALDDLVSSGAHTELTNGGPKGKCAMCGAKAPAGQSLLGCAGCKIAWYCGRECQVADWKRGHKGACKLLGREGLASLSMAEGELPSSRPWLQGFDDADHCDWPPHVEFAGSESARQTLARSPELRGPMSRIATLANVGFFASRNLSTMFPSFPQSDVPRANEPGDLLPLADVLSRGVEMIIRTLGAQGTEKTLARMAARGLQRRSARLPVGYVVVECNDPIEHVLGKRNKKGAGEAGTASIVVLFLDDASLRHYIAKRYEENHGARDPANARHAAQHLLKQLDRSVEEHGSSMTFHIVCFKHRLAPFYFSCATLGWSKNDAQQDAVFSQGMAQLLTTMTPHPMEAAQAAQVTLTLPSAGETIVSEVALYDLDQANFRVLVAADETAHAQLEQKLAAAGTGIQRGARVRVQGLVSSAHYNGLEGTILSELPSGRVSVRLDQGTELSLKPHSLQVVATVPRAQGVTHIKARGVDVAPVAAGAGGGEVQSVAGTEDSVTRAPRHGDVTALSVKEIKAALHSRGVSDSQLSACLDKDDLVALLQSTSPETASGSSPSANGGGGDGGGGGGGGGAGAGGGIGGRDLKQSAAVAAYLRGNSLGGSLGSALEAYYDLDNDALAPLFIKRHMPFLYAFAAVKFEQHGPGAVFVVAKLQMRELLSIGPAPAPFDGAGGADMDRFFLLLWCVNSKNGAKKTGKRGQGRGGGGLARVLEYESLSADLRSRTSDLPGLMRGCSLQGMPLVFVANPSGNALEQTRLGGTPVADLMRPPKFMDAALEQVYMEKGSLSLATVVCMGINFAGNPMKGPEELYALFKEHGDAYRAQDACGINVDRDCDDPNTS